MLKIFTAENKIVPGENLTQFTQLEYISLSSKAKNFVMPNLGLFGSASVGKTTSVKLLSEKLGYRLLSYNATNLEKRSLHETIFTDLNFTSLKESKRRSHPKLKWIGLAIDKPTIIFIDEAHSLSKDIQTLLLTALETDGMLIEEGYTFLPDDVTWILATTDSSKLLPALVSRLFPITFSQYSSADIAEMIMLNYPEIKPGAAKVISACSKQIPRMALKYSGMFKNLYSAYTEIEVVQFAKGVLGMDERGIDNTDKRILLYLTAAKKQASRIDEIAYKNFSEELAKLNSLTRLTDEKRKRKNVLTFKVAMLEAAINSNEYLPKSRQDISLSCSIRDMTDLETRLSYLESCNFVAKTPKGIILTPHVK